MYGIVDTASGKVFAKDPKFFKLSKTLELMRLAYPDRKFILTEVDSQATLVGEDLKKQKLTFERGG